MVPTAGQGDPRDADGRHAAMVARFLDDVPVSNPETATKLLHGMLEAEYQDGRRSMRQELGAHTGVQPAPGGGRRLESPEARRRVAEVRDDLLAKIRARHPQD